MDNNNSICIFDFIEEKWERKQPKVEDSHSNSSQVPYLESHSSCIDE